MTVSVFVSNLTGLRASEVTFKSFRVDWNPVSESFILGYRINVQNVRLSELIVPWNVTYAHIEGLRGNTTYTISVLPFHGLTVEEIPGENEESIIITTKPEPGKQLFGG